MPATRPQHPYKTLAFVLALSVMVSGLFTGCHSGPPQGGPPMMLPVSTQPVAIGDVEEASEYLATLRSRKSITLSPKVDGRVLSVNVRSGQAVGQGQVLIEIEPNEQQANVQSAQAGTRVAVAEGQASQAQVPVLQAQLQSAQAELKLAQSQFDRYQQLYTQKAASPNELDQYQAALTRARSQVDNLTNQIKAQQAVVQRSKANMLQSQAQVNLQQVRLSQFWVRAPFQGVVGDVPVHVGDYVTPQSTLLTLVDPGPIEAYLYVPAEKRAALQSNLPVQILDSAGKVLSESRLFFIAPNTDPDTQTLLVKALINNARHLLGADQQYRARVIWNHSQGLLIPALAVVKNNGRDFVFVPKAAGPKGYVAHQQAVTLGGLQGNRYVVTSGLKAGEQIIVTGMQMLADGMPIAPHPDKTEKTF